MLKRKEKKVLFPKEVFIEREEDGNNSYLVAWDKLEDASDYDFVKEIAVYELKEVKKLSVKRTIIFE